MFSVSGDKACLKLSCAKSLEAHEDKWEEAMSLDGEIAYWDMMYNFKRLPQFKHKVIFRPDGPSFIEQAWIAYIKKERPMMPDVRPFRQRPICYNGYKEVILSNGSTSFIERRNLL